MAVNRDIKYINREFSDFRSQLINFTQTYFPNTYTDFSPSSPGMLFMEQASYVGDVLSFYLDNQVQENFLQYARQTNNLYDLAYMYGYKPKATGLATVDVDFYQLLPSKNVNGEIVPDYDFALYVESNTQISSTNGINFSIEDTINFIVSSSMDPTTISIAQVAGGEPTYFLLKKTRKAKSGAINSTTFSFGQYEEFPTVEINTSNIAGIVDIFDDNGNEWYEVNYLGQELVFEGDRNENIDTDVPYILQTKQVQRRFATRFLDENTLQLQFGSGDPSNNDEDQVPNPNNIGLGLPSQESKLTTAYSPTNFIFTNTYGIAPSNTSLTVRYRVGGGVESNIAANTLTDVNTSTISFLKNNLDPTISNYIFNSIATNNESAASGGQDGDTVEEIRQNSISNFSSQLRNVTPNDYLVRALSMPPKYGIISKAFIQKPKADESRSTLDLYVLTYDINSKLTLASNTLKNNLKTYLNEYKMIGDTVNIRDGHIINIGVNFEVITLPNSINNEVLARCITEIQDYFDINKWQINQPIILRELYILLDKVRGIQTVKDIEITNLTGTNLGYSKFAYDIKGATQNNVVYPSLDPSIFEIKFPNEDIKGKIVSL